MSSQVTGILQEVLALCVNLSLAPDTPQVPQAWSISGWLLTNATETLQGQVSNQPLVFGRHLCLVLRLLKTLGTRHGFARCLPVHSPDALDAGARGGATDGTALSSGRQKKCLAGVAVQGEVDQLGRPVAFD